MNRFVKTFVGRGVLEVTDSANAYAKSEKLEIVTAQLSFSGSGRTFEEPVLTVVFEKIKPKRTRKMPGGKEEDLDE